MYCKISRGQLSKLASSYCLLQFRLLLGKHGLHQGGWGDCRSFPDPPHAKHFSLYSVPDRDAHNHSWKRELAWCGCKAGRSSVGYSCMPCTMRGWPLQQRSLAKGTCRTVHQGLKQEDHAGQKACPPIPGPACQPAQILRRGQLAGRRGWSEPEGADQARCSQLTGTVGGRTVDG